MVEEGWYTDPQDVSRLRYWDGTEWTEHTHDRPEDEPEPDPAEAAVDEPVAEEPDFDEPVIDEPVAEEPDLDEPPPPAPVESIPAAPYVPLPAPPPLRPAPSRQATYTPHTYTPPPSEQPAVYTPQPQPAPPPPQPRPAPPPPQPQPVYTQQQQVYQPQPQPAPPQPPPAPPQPPPAGEYPPVAPDHPPFAPESESDLGLPTATPGHLNDVGQWLRRTFKVGLAKLLPCGLLVVLGFIPAIFFYAVVYLTLSEASTDRGLGAGTVVMIILLAVLFVVWMVWTGVVTLAQNHLLYHAHIGNRVSMGQSVQAGLQGVGRLVWAYLTLVVYLVMVAAVVGGITFLFSLVSSTLGGVFFVVSYAAAMILSVWLGVKLLFLVVASAVAPPGDRPMVVSVETTNGYFWAVFGRMLLLGVILSAAVVPVMLIVGALFGTLGTSFIEDPGSGSASALIGSIAIGGVLYLLAVLAIQVFSTSGIVRLYVDLGGPAQAEQLAGVGPPR